MRFLLALVALPSVISYVTNNFNNPIKSIDTGDAKTWSEFIAKECYAIADSFLEVSKCRK
jgi:hypothetical protein